MSKGINLLGTEKQVSAKKASQKITLLRTVAISFLFIISGLSVVLFFLIELSPLPSLQKQEQKALTAISEYHPDIAKLLLVKERMQASEMILAKRSDFDQSFNKIKAKIPEGVAITGMKMESDEVTVTVTSSSLTQLDAFLNNLIESTKAKQDFSKVVLTKFISSQDNTTFNVTVSFVML